MLVSFCQLHYCSIGMIAHTKWNFCLFINVILIRIKNQKKKNRPFELANLLFIQIFFCVMYNYWLSPHKHPHIPLLTTLFSFLEVNYIKSCSGMCNLGCTSWLFHSSGQHDWFKVKHETYLVHSNCSS